MSWKVKHDLKYLLPKVAVKFFTQGFHSLPDQLVCFEAVNVLLYIFDSGENILNGGILFSSQQGDINLIGLNSLRNFLMRVKSFLTSFRSSSRSQLSMTSLLLFLTLSILSMSLHHHSQLDLFVKFLLCINTLWVLLNHFPDFDEIIEETIFITQNFRYGKLHQVWWTASCLPFFLEVWVYSSWTTLLMRRTSTLSSSFYSFPPSSWSVLPTVSVVASC